MPARRSENLREFVGSGRCDIRVDALPLRCRHCDEGSTQLAPRFTATDCPANMTTVMMVMVDLTEMAMMDDGENDVEMCKTRGRG